MFRKFYVVLSFLLFVLLFSFVYVHVFSDKPKADSESFLTDVDEKVNLPSSNFGNGKIKTLNVNRVIIVGDSRMEYLKNRGSNITIPSNFSFIAKGGSKIDWLYDYALNVLEEKLETRNVSYKYHVIFNMGVNDLDSDVSPESYSREYYNLYHDLALKYTDVSFYLLSVNPVDDVLINKTIPFQKRTDLKIVQFNDYTIKLINNDYVKNIKYCDSYNNIEFGMPDGLHYDKTTDQRIVNYIVNDCVDYDKTTIK